MDLQLVRCFLYVAESGSINKAARDLDMTQPALSRRITALEHQLRTQLFMRKVRGVQLTDAGLVLLEGARPLLRQAELLKDAVERRVSKQVAVGLPFSMHRVITAPFSVKELKEDRLGSLRVYEGSVHQLRVWMQQGLIDVAVMDAGQIETTASDSVPLATEPLLLVGGPGSGLAPLRSISAKELAAHGLILAGRPSIWRQTVENYLKKHGERLRRIADAETVPLCLALVAADLGCTVIPSCARVAASEDPRLRFAPIEALVAEWVIYFNPARRNSQAVKRLALRLQSFVAGQIGSGVWPDAALLNEGRIKAAAP